VGLGERCFYVDEGGSSKKKGLGGAIIILCTGPKSDLYLLNLPGCTIGRNRRRSPLGRGKLYWDSEGMKLEKGHRKKDRRIGAQKPFLEFNGLGETIE